MSATPCTHRTLALIGSLLLVAALAAATGWAAEPTASSPSQPVEEPGSPWLEDVRAQRQAWETRRRAAKEAIEARRRWQDPWATAEQEAREEEIQRRRDEWLERIDRNREAFRSQGPWYVRAGPPPTQSAESDRLTAQPAERASASLHDWQPPHYPPQGWDNGWYYKGY